MSLYTISEELMLVLDGGMIYDEETGEILFNHENVDDLKMEYADKLEGCGLYVKNLQAEVDALREEEKKLAERRKIKENKVERLKEYMLDSMERTNTSKLDTSKIMLSTRKSQKVIIDNDRLVPLKYIKTTETINKAEVKKALKSGDVPGAHLEENLSLQIK